MPQISIMINSHYQMWGKYLCGSGLQLRIHVMKSHSLTYHWIARYLLLLPNNLCASVSILNFFELYVFIFITVYGYSSSVLSLGCSNLSWRNTNHPIHQKRFQDCSSILQRCLELGSSEYSCFVSTPSLRCLDSWT